MLISTEGRALSVPDFLREKGYDPAEIGNAAQQKQFVEQALHMMRIFIIIIDISSYHSCDRSWVNDRLH